MSNDSGPAGLSALEGHVEAGRSGADLSDPPALVLEEILPASLVQLNGTSDPDRLAGVLSRFDIEGEPRPRLGLAGESGDLLWTGADQWWLVGRGQGTSAAEVRELCSADDVTSLDLGHSRTVLRVDGPMARELLAKGCPLDVDGLEAGFCGQTRLGPFSVVLHCRAERCFDLYVFRSFGLAMWEWLADEAAEFGYEVRRGG